MEGVPQGTLPFLSAGKIPRWVKLLVTLWVAVLVPEHWRATPLNLLWFCNVALLLTTAGLWLESSFLISTQAVGSLWWMLLWVLDFLIHLVAGIKTTPMPLGMSNYMFDSRLSLFSRGLSLYHGWLPFVLLFSIRRLGYDRRAVRAQTLLAWVLLLLSYALTRDIHGPAGNLNQVYGLSDTEPQHWVAPWLWLVLAMLFCPVGWYLPTHFAFRRWFPPREGRAATARGRHMETPEQRIQRVVREEIAISPYDPSWPESFRQEKEHLRSCLPTDLVGRIEHFGSTAVPGLAAKPIVDMLVEVTDLQATRERIAPALEAQGYDYFWRPTHGDDGPPFYAWFIRREPRTGARTHHIHMVEGHFAEHWDRLLFRDYLIDHPEVAKEYEGLKVRLASVSTHDRVAYTRGKTEFIVKVTERARRYYGRAS